MAETTMPEGHRRNCAHARYSYNAPLASGAPRDGMDSVALDQVVIQNSQEGLRLNEIQLLLSEKRTSLSALRTGIALLALPLSVVSFLVATSQLWNILDVLYLVAPLLALCATLVGLGSYLTMRALLNLQRFDR